MHCDICDRPMKPDPRGFGFCAYCEARIRLFDEHMEKGNNPMGNKLDELEKKYPILKFFHYDHLPPQLQEISARFSALAYEMAERDTTAFAEVAAGLRKLLEAKDCAVRAALP